MVSRIKKIGFTGYVVKVYCDGFISHVDVFEREPEQHELEFCIADGIKEFVDIQGRVPENIRIAVEKVEYVADIEWR